MPAAPALPSASIAAGFLDNIPNPFLAPDAPILNPEVTILVAISGFSVYPPPLGGGDMRAGGLDEEAGAGGGRVLPPAEPNDEE